MVKLKQIVMRLGLLTRKKITMKIGLLTSGGDCAGLNAVLRGFGKTIFSLLPTVEVYGIMDGYAGLIDCKYRQLKPDDFSNILTIGGTILGTSRQNYKKFLQAEDTNKIESIKKNYNKMGLDALIVLGGSGSHKTATLLSTEGLNIIGLPKTIDNDIIGTDVTFGFHTAVDVATECIDRLQTTAASHKRTIIVELMGNKVGWLTLYAGIAGGAHIILIPEIPFDMTKIIDAVDIHIKKKTGFCIIAASEGAMDIIEAQLGKKERNMLRAERGEVTASARIAKAVSEELDVETRVVVPGYIQRGGTPSSYDRVLCTQIGAYGARLAIEKHFGIGVALINGKMTYNSLTDIAGKTKLVPPDHELIRTARDIGVSFGD